jgi:phosphatidylglycerophosphate synthase
MRVSHEPGILTPGFLLYSLVIVVGREFYRMREILFNPANIATGVRFVFIPVLWVFAFLGNSFAIGIGMTIAGLTDSLDGLLARRLGYVTALGSKLDSIADHTLQLSAVIWLGMLHPEVFTENPVLVWSALGLNLVSLLIGLIKFKRFANLHLYTSKAASPLFFVFMVHTFLFPRYSVVLLYIACIGVIIAMIESITLLLMRDQVNEHIGSLLFLYLDADHPLMRFAPKRFEG